jgi:hypothetical protein
LGSGFAITTGRVAGVTHVLSLSNPAATPLLTSGNYAFVAQVNSAQQAALVSYFNSKTGWTAAMKTQIDSEITGNSPFFYLNAVGGTYALVDNFKEWLGSSYAPYPLTLDDDYPLGTYSYSGMLVGSNGAVLPLTITIIVQ